MRRPLVFQIAQPLLRSAAADVPRRCFTTAPTLAIDYRRVAGKIEIKTLDDKIAELPLNEKIEALKVYVKTDEGLSEPQWLDQLLDSIDRTNQYVLQINKPENDDRSIVRIVSRMELVQKINRQEDILRNHKRSDKDKRPKQLELNWAISTNDLQLKMKQMQDFLQKGKKVEVLLANKRRQRRASPEEAESLLKRVREKIGEVEAAEIVPMQGAVLRQATLTVKIREARDAKQEV